jgi:hypothetical protein
MASKRKFKSIAMAGHDRTDTDSSTLSVPTRLNVQDYPRKRVAIAVSGCAVIDAASLNCD